MQVNCKVYNSEWYQDWGLDTPKQPFFIRMRDDKPFAFAGLWERWRASDGHKPLDTFTILTTAPNELIAPIHNRMPVILNPPDYDRWLDRNIKAEGVMDLLGTYPAEKMEAYPISTRVNKAAKDSPDLIEPLDVP